MISAKYNIILAWKSDILNDSYFGHLKKKYVQWYESSTESTLLPHIAVSAKPWLYMSAIKILAFFLKIYLQAQKFKKFITFPTKIRI